MNKVLLAKIKEALISVLPITVIILLINFIISPMPALNLASFLFGAVFLIIGMGLYSLGTDVAIEPIGSHIGNKVTETRKVGLILFISFVLGVIVTIAEPDLSVLASQVPSINKWVLIITVAVGVGLFMVLSIIKTLLKIDLNVVLLVSYGIIFLLAGIFATKELIPLAFDSGGVTTGPITVPFIMAFGIGISAVMGGKNRQDNSFGMVGVCSIGPILAVILLGIFFKPEVDATVGEITQFTSLGSVMMAYLKAFPIYLKEVAIALAPIIVIFLIFQLFTLKLRKRSLSRILIGVLYTYLGLTIFLTGVNVGFMPAGVYIGAEVAKISKWLVIPIGMIVGACIVLAEPAVHVLNRQVEQITDGVITRKTMLKVLSVAMTCALGLSMLRVATGISIWWIIIPGYSVALLLSFFVPKIFTAIAFDSGGVASGPMTATFVLPFAMGATSLLGGNVMTDAFGVVTAVAMTPLIAIQVLGLAYRIKTSRSSKIASAEFQNMLATEGNIIDLTNVESRGEKPKKSTKKPIKKTTRGKKNEK